MWTDVTLGRNGRERQRNTATCVQQTDSECKRVVKPSFGEKKGGRWVRKRKDEKGKPGERFIDFGKSSKTHPPIHWFKELAHSQRGGAGATAGHKNMKWVQESPPSFSGLVLQDLPNNSSEGWSNSDAAVYGCRSVARTNNTWRTWWRPHFFKTDEIVAAPAHSEMFPPETHHPPPYQKSGDRMIKTMLCIYSNAYQWIKLYTMCWKEKITVGHTCSFSNPCVITDEVS